MFDPKLIQNDFLYRYGRSKYHRWVDAVVGRWRLRCRIHHLPVGAYISVSCNLDSLSHPTFIPELVPLLISSRLSNKANLEYSV